MAARPLLCKCGIKNGRTQRKVVGEELNNTLVAGRGGGVKLGFLLSRKFKTHDFVV